MTKALAAFRRISRRLLKHLISLALFYSGACAIFRRSRLALKGGRITILAYHGVNDGPFSLNLFLDVRNFAAQMHFLRRRYSVIPLSQAEVLLRSGQRLDRDYIVLTFDDGYKDNYRCAFPILTELGLPATIFLTTEPIDTGFPTFIYALILAIHATPHTLLDLTPYGLARYHLDDGPSREAAIAEIDQRAKHLSACERRGLLDEILGQLGLARQSPIFKDTMLAWDEIRHMRRFGITFGAHTVTHPVLSRLADSDIRREIAESKHRIERELEEEVTSFAYPYGGETDVNSTAADIVSQCGLSLALLLHDTLDRPVNLYALGRKMISNELTWGMGRRFSRAMFACELSGLFDLLLRRAMRVGHCRTGS